MKRQNITPLPPPEQGLPGHAHRNFIISFSKIKKSGKIIQNFYFKRYVGKPSCCVDALSKDIGTFLSNSAAEGDEAEKLLDTLDGDKLEVIFESLALEGIMYIYNKIYISKKISFITIGTHVLG
jgi:hypothetical protein